MIEIKLLSNRRFIYANRNQNIILTAENNATEIAVEYPDDYAKYSKRVDFVNSQGRTWTEALFIPEYKDYPSDYSPLVFRFTLPNEVTTPGELKMQFVAYKPDESMTLVPFEVIPIYVDEAMACFKKNSKSNPDLLLLSFNQSTEALFNSQQAKSLSKGAEEKINLLLNTAEQLKTAAEESAAVSSEAEQTAKEADDKADEALSSAGKARQDAEQAKKTANEAIGKAESAVETAEQVKATANTAMTAAKAAESKSAQAETVAEQASMNINAAVATANDVKQTAAAADSKADNALIETAQAKATAQAADNKASQAVSTADAALLKADATKATADYVKSRVDYISERSDEAIAIANDATALATQARGKANQAEQTAVTAQNLVSTAISDSENALMIATGIDAKAQTAIERSQSAKDASARAEDKSDAAVETADAAKALSDSVSIIVQAANEAANRAESKAAQAKEIADRTEAVADDAYSTAIAADGKAATALTRSNEAKAIAAQAQQDVEQVKESAVKAEESAQQAKTAADEAVALIGDIHSEFETMKEDVKTEIESATEIKVDKIDGKSLSTEDFTTEEKEKLSGIEVGAQRNVKPDWSEIQNKPAAMPASDVPAWAKAADKPSYTPSEIGAATAEQGTKADNAEPKFTKNTAFNKNFGTGAGTVTEGNDSRLSDAREPKGHKHTKADITDFPASMPASDVQPWAKAANKPSYTAGEVGAATAAQGTKADNAEPQFTKNGAFNKNFGSSAGTVCEGNDSRLSNARPASDVSSWAKAASKPSYSAGEVGAEPAFGKNNAFNKSFGTASGTVCQGNDSRLNGTRTGTFNISTASRTTLIYFLYSYYSYDNKSGYYYHYYNYAGQNGIVYGSSFASTTPYGTLSCTTNSGTPLYLKRTSTGAISITQGGIISLAQGESLVVL